MSTHNICFGFSLESACFRGEIRQILCGYPLLSVAMVKQYLPVISSYAELCRHSGLTEVLKNLHSHCERMLIIKIHTNINVPKNL